MKRRKEIGYNRVGVVSREAGGKPRSVQCYRSQMKKLSRRQCQQLQMLQRAQERQGLKSLGAFTSERPMVMLRSAVQWRREDRLYGAELCAGGETAERTKLTCVHVCVHACVRVCMHARTWAYAHI